MPAPRRISTCTRSSGPRTFAYLSGAALCLALLGLLSNLVHLQTLMNQQEHWMPSDWETHHFELLQATTTSRDSRKMTSVDDNDNALKEENVLRILSKRTVASLELCRGASNAEQLTRRRLSSADSSSSRGLLPRFGFLNELTSHMSLNMLSSANTTETSTKNDPRKRQQCLLAPSKCCQTSHLTMLVFAEKEESWRPLFLNLLHWVTDPLLSDIFVLLPASMNQSMLQDDIKYGHRLLSWHRDPTHKVTLIFGATSQQNGIWEQISQLVLHNATSDAVVIMNGDAPYNGNAEGLASGFELWKRHSSSLVVSNVWEATYQGSSSPMEATKEEKGVTFRPMCQEDSLTLSHNTRAVDRSLLLPDWSGMILHRSYLSCWLSHPVVAVLRSYDRFESSLAAMVLWLAQVSGTVSAALLYPANVLRDGKGAVARRKGQQGDLSGIEGSSMILQANTTDDSTSLAHSNLRKGEKRVASATRRNTSDARQLAKSLLATVNARSRRLDETQHAHLDEILTDVAGFFGSLPSKVNDWCSEGVGRQGSARFLSCSIPWTSSQTC